MSVTGDSDDPIPHGVKGARPPWNCDCQVCKDDTREYNRQKQAEYRARQKARAAGAKPATVTNIRKRRAAARTESDDSVPKRGKKIGEMEAAVIEEVAALDDSKKPKATSVVMAKDLAATLDTLRGNAKSIALYNSTAKQFALVMAEIRGEGKGGSQPKRKSGGRLATVGALTKVKRAQ